VLPTIQAAKAISNKKKYYELGTTKSGTFFTTSQLREHANEYKDLTDLYSRTQAGLVKEIVNIACQFISPLPCLSGC
jgi:DNA mismatch repair protein MSH2